MTLDDVARDLYGLAPSEFVAARTAEVEKAKDAGDKALATAIGKLRKPTVTAWTVNLLAREASDDVAALLQLGAALRSAQRKLSGSELRSLTGQRQQAVIALAKKAGVLAAEHEHPVSEGVLREVGQTLNAALADPGVAEQVHSGTLTTAATYDGFGPAGPGLVAVEDQAPEPAADPAEDNPRQELDDALAARESARAARDSAREEAERAADQLGDIDSRIAELKEALAQAEQERQFTRTSERTAQDQLRSAQKQLDRAERWVDRARERVDGE
ncbi:hypothetical protein ACIBCN_31000 [Nocardia sp. NPDC051052]|uniref:hypothetical protein n=1 Tax=Nocardia sp. NPDC051052 TaxID=3364322 RepID=UPI0037BC4E44